MIRRLALPKFPEHQLSPVIPNKNDDFQQKLYAFSTIDFPGKADFGRNSHGVVTHYHLAKRRLHRDSCATKDQEIPSEKEI